MNQQGMPKSWRSLFMRSGISVALGGCLASLGGGMGHRFEDAVNTAAETIDFGFVFSSVLPADLVKTWSQKMEGAWLDFVHTYNFP